MSGFVVLHRRALESWLWQLPPPQFKVAMTVLVKANWRTGQAFTGGQIVTVERGQLMTSFDSLAAIAGVSKKTVRTAFENLEAAGFIERRSARTHQVVTVCNYDKYQSLDDGDRHTSGTQNGTQGGMPSGTQNGTPSGTDRTSNHKPETRGSCSPQAASAPELPLPKEPRPRFDFEAIYAHYPRKQGKKRGMELVRKRVRTVEAYEELRAAVERMAELWRGHDTSFCPHWSTFVSQERWRDDELPRPKGATSPQAAPRPYVLGGGTTRNLSAELRARGIPSPYADEDREREEGRR